MKKDENKDKSFTSVGINWDIRIFRKVSSKY